MKWMISLICAYLLGSINPAAFFSRIKHVNLREHGTRNLGASNTLLILGKKWGALVMLLDILKSYLAVKLAQLLVPLSTTAIMASGFCAVAGHCFPFYMKFKGGKGLAAFAGVVLAYRPSLFVWMLGISIVCLLLVNHSFIIPFFASVTFPLYVTFHEQEKLALCFAIASSLLIFCKHFSNFIKACRGDDINIREYIRTKLFRAN